MEQHSQAETIQDLDASKPAPTPEEQIAQRQFAQSVPEIEREGKPISLFQILFQTRH